MNTDKVKHHRNSDTTGPAGSVVEHPPRDREVVGSNPGRAIPKALKSYQWLPCLVLSIIRQALASLLLTKYRTTNLATFAKMNKSEKSSIIINVCIHRRTVWKTGSYAKYVILLKYRDYYYYYYTKTANKGHIRTTALERSVMIYLGA